MKLYLRNLWIIFAIFFLLLDRATSMADEAVGAFAGASAKVTQTHVTAQLVPETNAIAIAKPFDVVLHLHMEPDWWVNWLNPGKLGSPINVTWKLPPGFTAGPIQWPTPEQDGFGRFGYEFDADLVTTITPPSGIPVGVQTAQLFADVSWIAGNKEQSMPGNANLMVSLQFGSEVVDKVDPKQKDFVDSAKSNLPVPNHLWDVQASYENQTDDPSAIHGILRLQLKAKQGITLQLPTAIQQFFVEQPGFHFDYETFKMKAAGQDNPEQLGPYDIIICIPLLQDERPKQINGIFYSDVPFVGKATAIYFSNISVDDKISSAKAK